MCDRSGDMPWYRSPPAWIGSGTKSCPSVCILNRGVVPAVSPKSYAYTPRVNDGQAAGSTARSTGFIVPASFSRRNGKTRPEKLDPPPVQPTITSGVSPAWASCLIASSPMTVWCKSTWLSTLPSAYRTAGSGAAISTASLIAMPRLPVESGCSASTALPAGVDRRPIGLHQQPPVGLLVVGGPDHPHLEVQPVQRARERQRAAPLAGPG